MSNFKASKAVPCNAFINSFLKNKLANLYYVFGEEEYFKNKVVNMIADRAISPDNRDFDFVLLYGDEVSPADAVDSFSTRPFISDYKVILIKKFDALKKDDQEKIIGVFEKVNVDNVLILTAESFDSRLKVSKSLLRIGQVIQCKTPYKAEEMLPWLYEEAKLQGKIFDQDAATLFVNKVELDFFYALNELEKLFLFCIDKSNITVHDVQGCTGSSKTHTIFDFMNQVGEKNITNSFVILENLLDNKEEPIFIITMLSRFFVQLWRINALKSKRCSENEILTYHLNDIHQFFRKNYLRYAHKYSLKSIADVFSLLLDADTDIKSVNIDKRLIVERMLFRIFSK